MEEIRESLGDMYDALEKVRKGMNSIQVQTHEMEDSYQKLMIMYIKEVGEDNVPLEWLDYCPYVGMVRDKVTGKISIHLIDPEELEK
jgi:hypothetical protein